MDRLVIIGAGGQGLVSFDSAQSSNLFGEILIFDDPIKLPTPIKVDFSLSEINKYISTHKFFVAYINNKQRKKMAEYLLSIGADIVSLVHPSACVSNLAIIEPNVFIGPLVAVNAGSHIKMGTILNTHVSIDHNCIVGEFCHIAPGSIVAGNVSLGEQIFLGSNSTVINNLTIIPGVVVGAGGVVVKDILEPGTYVGVPAKKVK